jgi:ribonucleotide reductase beta subunit family protein with ferritin-like domain
MDKEIEWAKYLLETGEEPGFTYEICEHFIRYWTNRRMKELHLKPFEDMKKNDIEQWFDDYRDVSNKQSALQEISNINYQLGRCLNDLHLFDGEQL